MYIIDINTRKIVTNLHKSLSKQVTLGNHFFSLMKLKIVIISFALYNLNKDEIDNVIRYCIQNDILLVFLEKEKPIEVSKELDFITIVNESVLY